MVASIAWRTTRQDGRKAARNVYVCNQHQREAGSSVKAHRSGRWASSRCRRELARALDEALSLCIAGLQGLIDIPVYNQLANFA